MANGIILHQQINIFKLHSIEALCRDLDIRLISIRPEDRNTPLGMLAGAAAGLANTPAGLAGAGVGKPQPLAAVGKPQPLAAVGKPQPFTSAVNAQPIALAGKSFRSGHDSSDAREMLVFCGLTPDLLDRFLEEYHRREIAPIELKAVLTAYNAKWTPKKLQTELIKENRL